MDRDLWIEFGAMLFVVAGLAASIGFLFNSPALGFSTFFGQLFFLRLKNS